jgi:hypothetical protein
LAVHTYSFDSGLCTHRCYSYFRKIIMHKHLSVKAKKVLCR